ncbi:hypothetical protein IL54_4820 [Sphingobium sp. ba1]|uniref:hypothetical protein n=1 Tax=Sphingobium sp. ba1 TaxID=1522072 RepID=UPI00068D0E9B|nr:hypothetical protein [Sphingobium sp. ba1]OMG61399.1 hypothetical protein IL54_4820 [Sphingobium sp. ba1]
MSDALYDCTGREIKLGDVLKVFHFTGRRRKAHYMYKQVVEIGPINPRGESRYLHISHLSLGKDRPYFEFLDGRVLSGYEIVQSIDAAFEDRPRLTPPPARGDRYE